MSEINNTTVSSARLLFGKPLDWWVESANLVYLWALGIAAVSAIVIAVLSWKIIGWQREIQAEKDASFAKYKLAAGKDIAGAHAAAETAISNTAAANLEIARLENASQQARLETERIKGLVVWREMPPTLPEGVRKQLKRDPLALHHINVAYNLGDPEGARLAIEIAQLFQECGWHVGLAGYTYALEVVSGIGFDPNPPDGGAIKEVLLAAGVDFTEREFSEPNLRHGGRYDGAPTIFIGAKPKFLP